MDLVATATLWLCLELGFSYDGVSCHGIVFVWLVTGFDVQQGKIVTRGIGTT